MDIQAATPEQIAAFEKGASARYKELGVPQQFADVLLAKELNKASEELGLEAQPQPGRVEKVASELAEVLGKTRTNRAA